MALLFGALGLQAQSAFDQAVFMHYTINPVLLNPAAAGFGRIHHVYGNFRSQWTGFPGSPNSYALNYNGPVTDNLGLGAGLMSESIGSLNRLGVRFHFSSHFQVGDSWRLAGGFTAEFQTESIEDAVMDSPLFQPGDDIIMQGMDGNTIFDATLGIYGTYEKNTSFGVAFPNLILTRLGEIEGSEPRGMAFNSFIVSAGHKFPVDAGAVILEPIVMFQNLDRSPFRLDANLLAHFADGKLTTGLSGRIGTGGALGLLLGTKIEAFSIYYSYDVGFQRFEQYSSGAHEVSLGFAFGPRDDYDDYLRF